MEENYFKHMKLMTENRPKAMLFALACVVSWAFIPVVARFGQQTLDNYQFLFWSSLLSFVVLFIATLASGKVKLFLTYKPSSWLAAILLGFLGSFLYYVLLYFAYAHAKGIEVLALQYTWPIFIVLFSTLLLRERLTTNSIIATLIGFLGVVVVLTKGNISQVYLGNITTDLLVLVAAAVFGLFSVLSKKTNYEPYTVTTIFFGSATIFSFIAMKTLSTFVIPTASTLTPLLLNGVLINGVSYILWLKALSYANASFVAQFVFLTPVIASLLIVMFFQEVFTPIYLLGMCLVIGAGIIAQSK